MRRSSLFCLLLMGVSLGGCNSVKRSLGLTHNPPDEFRVTTRSPLQLPPEYTLRPPSKDSAAVTASSAGGAQSAETARRMLIGDDRAAVAAQAALTAGEAGLLDRAGAERADPAIRAHLAQQRSAEEDEKAEDGFFSGLFSGDEAGEDGEVLDPVSESERLKNQRDNPTSSTGN